MDNKNILICMQQMGIGGVETVVLNQIQALQKRNYNVFIIGKFGTYTKKYSEYGATCIDFDFKLQKFYDKKMFEKIDKIIKKYEIKEMYIHSSECIPYVFQMCVKYKIPYVAYIHGGYKEVYEWYINNYHIFKIYFPLYFKNAYKNVSITNKAKENIIKMFELDNNENFTIIPNSINFNNILVSNSKNSKSKLLILSRLSKEKEQSIINAIDFFKEYRKSLPEARLSILGTGNAEDTIKEYVKKLNLEGNIKFIGESDDVYSIIGQHDIVFGMGRCILEAIAMKKIAIISGYSKLTGIVKKNNIQKACEENFTDRYEGDCEDVLKQLVDLDQEEIEKIINENYNFCYKNCNIDNNFIHIDSQEKVNYEDISLGEVLDLNNELVNYYEKEIIEKTKELKQMYSTNLLLKEQIKSYKEEKSSNRLEELINENKRVYDENKYLTEEIEKIYNSRRWKYSSKLVEIIKKVKK